MNIFHLSQKVEIMDELGANQEKRIFQSRIEDITKSSLAIAVPYAKGCFMTYEKGGEINARVTDGGCACLFTTTVLGSKYDPIPLWVVALPTTVKKIQLRNFVRLDVNLGVQMELGEEAGKGWNVSTLTKDISGGGIQVLLPTPLSIGIRTKITLPLSDRTVVEAKGEVVRVIPPLADYGKYGIGIKFTAIEERTRDGIIKYIFQKQVERRRKLVEIAN